MEKTLDFYFDFSSPYGYFAASRIEDLAARYGYAVQWHPILLGAIFKVTDTTALAMVPLKGEYSLHDFERSARFHGIAYTKPSEFPLATQLAARAMLWLQREYGANKARTFAQAVYQAYFVENLPINQPDVMAKIAAGIGIPGEEIIAGSNDPLIKEQLKTEIDAALARGVFGSPFILVGNEAFWGFDRFDQLEAYLKNGKI